MNRRHFIQSLVAGTAGVAAVAYGVKPGGMKPVDQVVDPMSAAYFLNLRTGTLVCHSDYGPSAVRYIDTGEWDMEIPENVMAVWFPPPMHDVERWCEDSGPGYEVGPLTQMARRMIPLPPIKGDWSDKIDSYWPEDRPTRPPTNHEYKVMSPYGRSHIFTRYGAR